LPKATIFDLDGTLLDSVDLHALAWHEAMAAFGHDITFEQARSQIGKGGDKLIPVFLSERQQAHHGRDLEEWRGKRFKANYLPLIRPFSAVPELLKRARDHGLKIAVATSAKQSELEEYLKIAKITELVEATISSDDVKESKPEPDVFNAVLRKLNIPGKDAVAVGDTPYDAEAARKAGVPTIGFLSGGFEREELLKAGCAEIYPGPSGLLACFGTSLLAK
jgi:HAD superfamily hydrolase (TIGR01549 family)